MYQIIGTKDMKKTFKDLGKGQEILLNNMSQAEHAVVEAVKVKSVLVRWEDGTTDDISINEEVEEVKQFETFSCGFQVKINK